MDIKQCCVDFYQKDLTRLLFGESMHPGGLGLTKELCEKIFLKKESKVLDLACGIGTTAIFLAKEFGCNVTGLDLGQKNIEIAKTNSENMGIVNQIDFQICDAEKIKFENDIFDQIICECAFCLFPNKTQTSQEIFRVTKKGGMIGISDVVIRSDLPVTLKEALFQFICVLEAKSEQEYEHYLQSAGFSNIQFYDKKDYLLRLIDDIKKRLFAAELLIGLGKIKVKFDIAKVKKTLQEIKACVETGLISYMLITGIK